MSEELFPIIYNTSRSAIETGWHCPRERFLQYHYNDIGIMPSGNDIYLSTGSALHYGVELLAKAVKANKGVMVGIDAVDEAVSKVLKWYRSKVPKASLSGGGLTTDEGRIYSWNEQQALIEACIRVWARVEMPFLSSRYRILHIEKDVSNRLVGVDGEFAVDLETKADLLLQHKASRLIYVYSLKGLKRWDSRNENSYKNDLQGITETWGMEKFIKARNATLVEGDGKVKWSERIAGVYFCILKKGDRKEKEDIDGTPTGIWFTYNPFIRGYRSISARAGGVTYAHSYFYEKEGNKSGQGTIGKGWEPFNVWEDYKGGIKQWMHDIGKGVIQPGYSSKGYEQIFKEWVITPEPINRDAVELKATVNELRGSETHWYRRLELYKQAIAEGVNKDLALSIYFPRHRTASFFPQECDYTGICYGNTTKNKGVPLEESISSGKFKYREPHHIKELERVKGILGSRKEADGKT